MGWGVINRGIVCREKIPQFVYSQWSFVSCSIKTYSSTLRLNTSYFFFHSCSRHRLPIARLDRGDGAEKKGYCKNS
jgi:hypothetical protein